jgi:hypothetical protein
MFCDEHLQKSYGKKKDKETEVHPMAGPAYGYCLLYFPGIVELYYQFLKFS